MSPLSLQKRYNLNVVSILYTVLFYLIKVAGFKMISTEAINTYQILSKKILENTREATSTQESCKVSPTHLCVQWARMTKCFDLSWMT